MSKQYDFGVPAGDEQTAFRQAARKILVDEPELMQKLADYIMAGTFGPHWHEKMATQPMGNTAMRAATNLIWDTAIEVMAMTLYGILAGGLNIEYIKMDNLSPEAREQLKQKIEAINKAREPAP